MEKSEKYAKDKQCPGQTGNEHIPPPLTDIWEDENNQGGKSISSNNLAKQGRESIEMR